MADVRKMHSMHYISIRNIGHRLTRMKSCLQGSVQTYQFCAFSKFYEKAIDIELVRTFRYDQIAVCDVARMCSILAKFYDKAIDIVLSYRFGLKLHLS